MQNAGVEEGHSSNLLEDFDALNASLLRRILGQHFYVSGYALFMGANSYTARPELDGQGVRQDRSVKTPSFFCYMAWWATVLIPLFLLVTLIWFR